MEQASRAKHLQGSGRRFIKGVSGNPSGRPNVPQEVVDLARAHTELAVQTLATICKKPKASPSARVMAAVALLDRGWGKPVQPTENKNVSVDLSQLTDAQLFAILQEMSPGAVLPGLPAPDDLEAMPSAGNS